MKKFVLIMFYFLNQAAALSATKAVAHIGLRATATKFLIAMGAVFLSSLIIFICLTVYNKVFVKNSNSSKSYSKNTLQSPKNLKEAINIFLNKTDF